MPTLTSASVTPSSARTTETAEKIPAVKVIARARCDIFIRNRGFKLVEAGVEIEFLGSTIPSMEQKTAPAVCRKKRKEGRKIHASVGKMLWFNAFYDYPEDCWLDWKPVDAARVV
jgi:hypothetical protein